MEHAQQKRYPPWWVYVLVIVPANLAVTSVLPDDANFLTNGLCTVVVIAGLYWFITAVYRRATADRATMR